jgi:hypothetical protein
MSKYFYVYQNKTFGAEFRGGFLWSPQFSNGWRPHPGYECMKQVREGDIIFHSFQSAIVAVSRAKTDCYSAMAPGPEFDEWDRNGWRVDVQYLLLPTPWIVRESDKLEMYRIQPANGPFLSNGRGKQQYLCNVNVPVFEYLIDKILKVQRIEKAREQIRNFLDCTPPLPPPPHTKKELQTIEDGCKVDAILIGKNKEAILTINIEKFPNQKAWLGKKVGDVLKTTCATLSYRVERIYKE